MSVSSRVAVKTTTLTRDPQNTYTINLTDSTLTQNRSYNNFGEVTEISDNKLCPKTQYHTKKS